MTEPLVCGTLFMISACGFRLLGQLIYRRKKRGITDLDSYNGGYKIIILQEYHATTVDFTIDNVDSQSTETSPRDSGI